MSMTGPPGPRVLSEHRAVLKRLADVRVERETIDRAELERLAKSIDVPVTTERKLESPARA